MWVQRPTHVGPEISRGRDGKGGSWDPGAAGRGLATHALMPAPKFTEGFHWKHTVFLVRGWVHCGRRSAHRGLCPSVFSSAPTPWASVLPRRCWHVCFLSVEILTPAAFILLAFHSHRNAVRSTGNCFVQICTSLYPSTVNTAFFCSVLLLLTYLCIFKVDVLGPAQ